MSDHLTERVRNAMPRAHAEISEARESAEA